jgi:ferredoxin
MRVAADQDRCAGSGQCVLTAPEVFDQRAGDGVVIVRQPEPPAAVAAAVRAAAQLCPVQAITVESR